MSAETDPATAARDTVRAYLDTWNATDLTDRRRLLHQHWSADLNYVDPLAAVRGRDDLSAVIDGVHEKFPHLVFSLTSEIDAHHDQLRFQWGLGREGSEPIAIGFDVVVLDQDGRIRDVLGFLDRVPA